MAFKVKSVVGARPNFIKIAPLDREIKTYREVKHLICLNRQHFDKNLSNILLEQLATNTLNFNLSFGRSHAQQLASILAALELGVPCFTVRDNTERPINVDFLQSNWMMLLLQIK
ncbi:MAG: hypothetical protein M0Q90_04990 [Bacteroidales bacterium]|nr:hypothetical protein [Bacteroidales bacterium]